MDVKDIKLVLELAQQNALDEHSDELSHELRSEAARQASAIEAVETWLTEIGALPPR